MEPINLNLFRINNAKMGISSQRTTPPLEVAKPFAEILQDSIKRVSDLQQSSDNAIQRLSLGEVDDISEVSIAVEKAELSLRLMVQVRDKLVDAYQQVARMSV